MDLSPALSPTPSPSQKPTIPATVAAAVPAAAAAAVAVMLPPRTMIVATAPVPPAPAALRLPPTLTTPPITTTTTSLALPPVPIFRVLVLVSLDFPAVYAVLVHILAAAANVLVAIHRLLSLSAPVEPHAACVPVVLPSAARAMLDLLVVIALPNTCVAVAHPEVAMAAAVLELPATLALAPIATVVRQPIKKHPWV